MSDGLGHNCQRCGSDLKGGVTHISVVTMETTEKHNEFAFGHMWLCIECEESLRRWMEEE